MPEILYRLVFEGEIAAGQDHGQVKKSLSEMLKLNERQTARLFSGEKVVVKKEVDARTAKTLRQTFEKAGAVLKVEVLHSKRPSQTDEVVLPPEAVSESRGPVSESTGDLISDVPPVYTRTGTRNGNPMDLPAITVFMTASIVLIILSVVVFRQGVDFWNEKRWEVLIQSKSGQVTPGRPSTPDRDKAGQKTGALSKAENLLLRGLHQEGLQHIRKGEYEKAESPFRKRLEMLGEKGGKNHMSMPAAMNDLAFVLGRLGRLEAAEKIYGDAVNLCGQTGREEDLAVAVASEGLARIYVKQGKLNDVDALYLCAIRIWNKSRGEDNGNSLVLKQCRADLLEKLGRKEEADQLRRYVNEARKRLLE